MKKYNALVRRVLACAVLSVFAAALCLTPQTVHAASNFIIEDYDIQVVVNEDDTYEVTETLRVHFTYPSHGIYRSIPRKTTLDRDGQQSSYYASIDDFTMLSGESWKDESESGKFMARIGDADRYAETDTVYKLQYTYDTKGDHFKDGDEVYYNLIGTDWEAQSIDHVSFDVRFPKAIDMSKVGIKTGLDQYVDFTVVSDTELSGETTDDVMGGLTIRAVLPEGYFTRQAKSPSFPFYILIGIMAILSGTGVGLWRKYGVDPHVVETEEFYPPKGLSAPEVGYLDKGEISGEHVISTLLSLADRGYLKIREIDVPTGIRKKKTKKSYEIVKLREYDDNILGEKTFMDGLFTGRDQVEMSELKNKFYKTVDAIKSKIKKQYKGRLYDTKAAGYAKLMRACGAVGLILLVILSQLGGGGIRDLMSETFSGGLTLFGSIVVLFVIGFHGITKKINERRGYIGIIGYGICIAIGLFLSFLFELTAGAKFIPFIIGLAMCFVLFLMSALCERKTDWYAEVLGKIRGYKNFLEVAEKDRMEALAEEDPEYFYKNLAFAFALGVTSVYAKNFASLATEPPQWYETRDPYIGGNSYSSLAFLDSMDSMMSSVSNSMTSSPSDGGGGGSFSGGGGGGGGGGGSW